MSEILLGDLVPFEDHITDEKGHDAVLISKTYSVMAMFSAAGVCPDTADDAQVAAWFDQIHNAYKNIHAPDVQLDVWVCHGEADPETLRPGLHDCDFTRELDTDYLEHLRQTRLYENPTYLALTVCGESVSQQKVTRFLSEAPTDPRPAIRRRYQRLNELCSLLQAQLKMFGLQRLGYVTRDQVMFDEIAEALVFALTGVKRQIGASTGRMGHAMFSETIENFFGDRHLTITGAGNASHYAAIFGLREYPTPTIPGILHRLAQATYRSTLHQSYRFLSLADSISKTTWRQHRYLMANDKAKYQIAELDQAAQDLQGRKYLLGDYSFNYLVFAANWNDLDRVSLAAWHNLSGCGLQVDRLDHKVLKAAWLSMIPGNSRLRPRPGYVRSDNFIAFSPFYNWPLGEERGHWPGPPITLRTVGGTPWWFHWHPKGSTAGNALVTGVVGGGKTFTIGFTIAETAGRARGVVLDYKQGWRILAQRMGASYAVLGDRQPHFNMLRTLDNVPASLEFINDECRLCAGGEWTEEESRKLTLGIEAVMALTPPKRKLEDICAFLGNEPEGAGVRLRKWCWGEELGWVIDAPRVTVDFKSRWTFLDTTKLLDNPRARGAAFALLYHQISTLLDGTPFMLVGDETWRSLDDPGVYRIIDKQTRTIRSFNGIVVWITQSPTDFMRSGIAHILREECDTHIHLPNPRAPAEDYVIGKGGLNCLTQGQWEALHNLQRGDGFLVVQDGKGMLVQLLVPDQFIPILSAPEIELRRAEQEFQEAAE